MITSPANYQLIFSEIQNSTSLSIKMVNEDTEPKFVIDADTRYIDVPEELATVGVYTDHNAETVYFEMDRMFDTQDFSLTDLTCVIQYKNALGREFIYPVTTLYLVQQGNEEVPSKINFAWTISGNVTAAPGDVSFSVRFYRIENEEFVYNFNTQPAIVGVYDGLNITEGSEYQPPKDDILALVERIEDLIESGSGGTGGTNNYVDLQNKPAIDGVELYSGTTSAGLGLLKITEFEVRVEELKKTFLTQENIDSVLVETSTNAIQNQVVTKKFKEIQKAIDESAYIPIEINSFTNTTNIAEKGQKITSVTFNYSFNQTPASLVLDGTAVGAGTTTYTKSGLSITEDTSFLLNATDKKGLTVSATTDIKFLNGVYCGVAEAPTEYNSAFVLALTKTLQNNNEITFEANAADAQYIYYCVPSAYGTARLSVNGLVGGFEKIQTITLINSYNYSADYDIYKSEYDGLGSTIVKVE